MQHVEIPNELINLKREGKLEQGDQVIFASIKKFMNSQTRECFPSITTISKVLNCSRGKILAAIERLCNCGLLEKKNNGRGSKNTYMFVRTEFDNFFEMFTEDFLRMNIPLNIKEYYMGVQQFLYGKDTGIGKCTFNNTEIADRLGISPLSVKKYNTYLIENNFLEEESTNSTDESGLPVIQKNFNLTSLNQAALWVKAVTEQIVTNTEDIEELKKEVATLKKELSIRRNATYTETTYPL